MEIFEKLVIFFGSIAGLAVFIYAVRTPKNRFFGIAAAIASWLLAYATANFEVVAPINLFGILIICSLYVRSLSR